MLTPEQIAEIEARAGSATPGDWLYDSIDRELYVNIAKPHVPVIAVLKNNEPNDEDQLLFDGLFLAHARTDVPALIATISEMREAHEKRVTELLEANNARLEEKRAAEARIAELEATITSVSQGGSASTLGTEAGRLAQRRIAELDAQLAEAKRDTVRLEDPQPSTGAYL